MAEISEHAPSTKTWEGADSPGATRRASSFQSAWERSKPGRRPDPRAFLPESANERLAALLAILLVEIGLRWDGAERATVEHYRDQYPELPAEAVVELAYEEFLLREQGGDAPVPREYEDRLPEYSDRLRRVFDIHELVGSSGSTSFRERFAPEVPFPETGQTTGGFRLLEELGRGAFARVFRAEERQLADRPVALKVSRTGSREPQTLARLQHTHIVPVHSYRTDVATGLHLLCMPFWGRTTLERLLADPQMPKARTGADVLLVLERLEPNSLRVRPATRSVFASLPFARAMAWWGARMAEALAHAHERGVLHRDIKPSNVLVTADGVPMLLDFNLARDPNTEAAGPSMGGTLAYMSPEHLDALAEGHDESVDERADVFSLGVLLFETLTGRRPYRVPTGATSVAEALHRAAAERREARPTIRETHPEIPTSLESVVLKCLAVDPADRYATAADLALDLQAVADDEPLVHAREPLVSRTIRFARRRRWPIVLVGLIGLAWVFLANAVIRAHEDHQRTLMLLSRWIDEGVSLAGQGRLIEARDNFIKTAQLATSTSDFHEQPPLVEKRDRALDALKQVNLAIDAAKRADIFAKSSEHIRMRRGDGANGRGLTAMIDDAIKSYLTQDLITLDLARLDSLRRERLQREFEEALFTRTLVAPRDDRGGVALVELGRAMAFDRGPWNALAAMKQGKSVADVGPSSVSNPATCVLYGLLAEARGDQATATIWLKRAARLDPDLSGVSTTRARLATSSH